MSECKHEFKEEEITTIVCNFCDKTREEVLLEQEVELLSKKCEKLEKQNAELIRRCNETEKIIEGYNANSYKFVDTLNAEKQENVELIAKLVNELENFIEDVTMETIMLEDLKIEGNAVSVSVQHLKVAIDGANTELARWENKHE